MAKKKRISGGFGKFNMDDKSFGKAFNKFKAEGINPFPYKGKMYSTKTRDEVEKTRAKENKGSSSSYKMTSDYATAPKKPKVEKKVNMPSTKSTRSDTPKSDKVKGTTSVKTERKKNKGVFGFKKGGRIDGIAKKGKTKGRII